MKDREELRDLLDKICESAKDCFENHNVLPHSITFNGKTVGLKLTLYNIDESEKDKPCSDAAE